MGPRVKPYRSLILKGWWVVLLVLLTIWTINGEMIFLYGLASLFMGLVVGAQFALANISTSNGNGGLLRG